MLTAVQIASRVGVLWTVVHKVDIVQTSVGLPLMLFAWTVTEIIRYSYYTLNLVSLRNIFCFDLLCYLRGGQKVETSKVQNVI